jgi:hypothetical protein
MGVCTRETPIYALPLDVPLEQVLAEKGTVAAVDIALELRRLVAKLVAPQVLGTREPLGESVSTG